MDTKDLSKLLISGEQSIRSAMKQLNETSTKNLFAVNDYGQLIGSISDGDIRRSLLNGISLEEKVEKVINVNPKYVFENESGTIEKLKKIMLDYGIESIPIINEQRIIINIVYWVDIFTGTRKQKHKKRDNKVFLLAGGMGARLEPFTRILPKPLIPIGDQPILEKIMDKFVEYGYVDFILSLYYKSEMIKLYLNDPEIRRKYSSLDFIHEDQPLGTIGSVYLAKDKLKETFFITNTDILIEEDLNKVFSYHKDNNAILTLIGCIKNSKIPYGVVNIGDDGYLINITEKPEYNHVVNTGVYIAEPEIIDYVEPNKRMDITELIEIMVRDKKKVCVYPILEEQWFDIGQWSEYEKTRKIFENK